VNSYLGAATVLAWLFAAIAAGVALPAAAGPAADAVAEPPQRLPLDRASSARGFVEIDALLRQGNWAAALGQLRTQEKRLTSNPGRRGEWLARVALAEAGSGQGDQAVWDWAVANALATGLFTAEELRDFGAAGALLAGRPRRQPGQAPPALSLEPPGPEVQNEVKTQGELPPLAHTTWEPRPSLRVEVVVDEKGRLRDPLVLSARSGEVAYRALEAMSDWRFEPAKKHGQPVATLHSLVVEPPGQVPIERLITLSLETKMIEVMLHRQQWRQAAELAEQRWYGLLDGTEPGGGQEVERAALGMAMALRALARAGLGGEEQAWARCRWEAAQSLLPRLYDLDLSPYARAGEAVAAWRREAFTAPFQPFPARPEIGNSNGKMLKPEKIEAGPPHYPDAAKKRRLGGKVILESVLDTEGTVRNPALADPLDAGDPVSFAASALDAVCDYRFRPATLDGKPVKVYYTLTVTFKVH
jgi:TonB family protein